MYADVVPITHAVNGVHALYAYVTHTLFLFVVHLIVRRLTISKSSEAKRSISERQPNITDQSKRWWHQECKQILFYVTHAMNGVQESRAYITYTLFFFVVLLIVCGLTIYKSSEA